MLYDYAVQQIKDGVAIERVCERYGVDLTRGSFASCPFHGERTPSLRVYRESNSFHCFGCGAHGDVISFVQKLFDLSFPDALRKIDADFGLNIYGDHTFEELRRSHYKQMAIRAERERKKREKEQADKEYWAAFDEWKRLDDNRRLCKPKSPDEELHPLFVESLQKLTHQEYLVDCLDERRRQYA